MLTSIKKNGPVKAQKYSKDTICLYKSQAIFFIFNFAIVYGLLNLLTTLVLS